jgi:hypothetical protein
VAPSHIQFRSRKVVLIAESSTQSKIRINDYNNLRKYGVRRPVSEEVGV